jgi:response regulator RpfG family c-di-GMP phosphodiesterase
MPTVLCLDDFTCGLADAAQVLRDNGYRVLAADHNAAFNLALEFYLCSMTNCVIRNQLTLKDLNAVRTNGLFRRPLAFLCYESKLWLSAVEPRH